MRNLVIIFILLWVTSCKDKENHWYVKQVALKFGLSDSYQLYKLLNTDSIKLGYAKDLIYYDSAGIKTKLNYIIITKNTLNTDSKYFISVGDIAWMSSGQNIKNYYISWPNGETDTLYAEYRQESTPYKNSCSCGEPLVELKLNGKSYIRKTNYDMNGIYIFDR